MLVQGGRKYRLCAVAPDGSGLYRSDGRASTDYWVRTPTGEEKAWSFVTSFGRTRPLPPPAGGAWQRRTRASSERRSRARSQLLATGLPLDPIESKPT